jgi:hypothetical protein
MTFSIVTLLILSTFTLRQDQNYTFNGDITRIYKCLQMKHFVTITNQMRSNKSVPCSHAFMELLSIAKGWKRIKCVCERERESVRVCVRKRERVCVHVCIFVEQWRRYRYKKEKEKRNRGDT